MIESCTKEVFQQFFTIKGGNQWIYGSLNSSYWCPSCCSHPVNPSGRLSVEKWSIQSTWERIGWLSYDRLASGKNGRLDPSTVSIKPSDILVAVLFFLFENVRLFNGKTISGICIGARRSLGSRSILSGERGRSLLCLHKTLSNDCKLRGKFPSPPHSFTWRAFSDGRKNSWPVFFYIFSGQHGLLQAASCLADVKRVRALRLSGNRLPLN